MQNTVIPVSTQSIARHIMACFKLILFLVSTLFLLLLHLILYGVFRNKAVIFIFHRFNCFLFGLNAKWQLIDAQGDANALTDKDIASWQLNKNVVYLGNHISYLDILVLGARLEASFVAKADVRNWPLFGFLAKLQNTVFISRRPKDIEKVSQSIAKRMSEGGGLIIFPEGTSSDGQQVLPLKSSLFALFTPDTLQGQDAEIITFTISLKGIEGQGVNSAPSIRDYYAWYGEMTLVPHLWALAHLKRVDLQVTLAPVQEDRLGLNRKKLSVALHKQISKYL